MPFVLLLIFACLAAYGLGRSRGVPVELARPAAPVEDTGRGTGFSDIAGRIFIPSPVTAAVIFSEDHGWTATISADRIRTIIATGDVIPARSVNNAAVQKKSFIWPYEKTAELLKKADITVVNLETPLLTDCPVTVIGMNFCGDARHVEGLVYSGVDVAGLANNHAGNHGVAGIEETVSHLGRAGIAHTGTPSQPVVKDVRGVRFVFLSFNDIGAREQGIAWAENTEVRAGIETARKRGDVVIASFHWGAEYQRLPGVRQTELAHLAVDAGADVVLGNHPHWIQPPEMYKGKCIMYAHGNFVFDQEWSEETKLGVVGRYTFYDTALIDVEFIPIRIVEYGQPYLLESAAKRSVIDMLKQATYELSRR